MNGAARTAFQLDLDRSVRAKPRRSAEVPAVPGPSGWDAYVDVYLSAGPHEAPTAAGGLGRSCNQVDNRNCSIWRVRVGFSATGTPVSARATLMVPSTADWLCPGGWGFAEPAVSPSGDRLAWVGRCHEERSPLALGAYAAPAAVIGQVIGTYELSTGEAGAADYGWDGDPDRNRRPQFPNWYDEETLTYDKAGGPLNASMNTLWWAWRFPDWSMRLALLGPEGLFHTSTAYQDGESHPSPRNTGVGSGPRMVSFGGQFQADPNGILYYELVPRTHGLSGELEQEFQVPDSWEDRSRPECHHPSWNVSGTEILCTRLQDADIYETTGIRYDYRELYRFSWGAVRGAWNTTSTTPLIDRLVPDEVAKLAADAFGATKYPLRASNAPFAEGCGAYVWKFAHWCGSDRYLVATVYCTDNSSDALVPPNLASRVYLIDTEADTSLATAYFDLVAPIEGAAKAETGSYHAIFSDCAGLQRTAHLDPIDEDLLHPFDTSVVS